MHFHMLFESSLVCVSLVALIALEWSLPSVLPHVLLQITRSSESKVAQVTFKRLSSGVLSHNVIFQMTSCDARILAACASVWLYLQSASSCASSGCLIVSFYIHIDCSVEDCPRCAA